MHIFIVYKEWIVNWYYVCLFKLTGTTSLCFFENIFHSLCSCEQTVFPSHYILANISYCQTLKSFPTWCTKMLRHCIFILHFWLPVKMDCFSICLLAILMSSYWNISIFSLIFYLKKIGFWVFLQFMQHWYLLLQRPTQHLLKKAITGHFMWNGFLHLLSISPLYGLHNIATICK